jgi:DNA repair protein RadC
MKKQAKFLHIKNWAVEDRPREKLLLKGTAALSDAELIAILLGTGTASTSAVDLAKTVLQSVGHNLDDLARLSVNDLMKIKGIGEAKAIAIISALELGRRRKDTSSTEKPKISSSGDAYSLLKSNLMDKPHEEFWVLLLNRNNRLIKMQQVSLGGVHGTVADPKIIFKLALEELASIIIVAHNHPSGNLTPSRQDIDLTNKLKESSKLLEITLADHLIIAGKEYFSFADEGLL